MPRSLRPPFCPDEVFDDRNYNRYNIITIYQVHADWFGKVLTLAGSQNMTWSERLAVDVLREWGLYPNSEAF